MNGDYFGYDGPCPPWNDSIAHRYVFTVYALDVAELPFEGRFNGGDAIKAIQGHVLAQASRSEERRVGKECVSTGRARWSPVHKKKKTIRTIRYDHSAD